MDRKALIGSFAAAVMLLSLLVTMLNMPISAASTNESEYMTVEGVLDSDYYSLYPFENKGLKIGFSKYGEFINAENNVGLEYDKVDPFAAPAGSSIGSIPKVNWVQGWLINITYYNKIMNEWRNVWAYAGFSDSHAWGGSWIRVDFDNDYSSTYGFEDPRDPGYIIGNYAAGASNFGGRKTNGTAVTAPIEVLYDGPRRFVAKLETTIYDHPVFLSDSNASDIPLVKVIFTIIFNKVKKEVMILKDVKSILSEKTGSSMFIQFSNRGEVDLGTEDTGYHSYFHFFTAGIGLNDPISEGLSTVYNSSWTMCKTVDPAAVQPELQGLTAAGPYPQDSDATFDVAQAINPDAGYVWWAAFWPSLSDWTIDGWDVWWRSMSASDPHYIDGVPEIPQPEEGEPKIPFYIGEWDFVLYAKEYYDPDEPTEYPIQFRGVTVYGVTDLNDGKDTGSIYYDPSATAGLDSEVKYQLAEIFKPWDLYKAVEKNTRRWVEFDYDSDGKFTTSYGPVVVVKDEEWDDYCAFSERVIDLTENELEARKGYNWRGQDTYTVTYNPDGTMTISGLDEGHDYKILYSTYTSYTNYDDIGFSWTFTNVTRRWASSFSVDSYSVFTDVLGVTHEFSLNYAVFTITNSTTLEDGASCTLSGTMDWWAEDIKVFKETPATIRVYWQRDWEDSATEGGITITFDRVQLDWTVTPPEKTDVHIDWAHLDLDYRIEAVYNAIWDTYNITVWLNINGWGLRNGQLYDEHIPGRYEWVVVGRDADTTDMAGADLVSAAFKNKQVERGLTGEDMMNSDYKLQMPWVIHKFGTEYTRDDFLDERGRAALRDDWCTTWPISSSNLIAVGGPIANLLTYYVNDFTDAFYAIEDYAAEVWDNKIVALSCWSKKTYAPTANTGYAVIATYKDLNGTVIFAIWGYDGRDTYYATKWFHEEGIYQLQNTPAGVTSIILKISYESTDEGYKPTDYSIEEVLGTISERLWVHNDEKKGGIHDP